MQKPQLLDPEEQEEGGAAGTPEVLPGVPEAYQAQRG
jgi:hypothetical protein